MPWVKHKTACFPLSTEVLLWHTQKTCGKVSRRFVDDEKLFFFVCSFKNIQILLSLTWFEGIFLLFSKNTFIKMWEKYEKNLNCRVSSAESLFSLPILCYIYRMKCSAFPTHKFNYIQLNWLFFHIKALKLSLVD